MKKKCKVVKLFKDLENGKESHLYIISDDEIKEGDWCIDVYDGLLYQASDEPKGLLEMTSEQLKKIIASTDPELCWAKYDDCDGTEEIPNKRALLPQIPESFIKAYVAYGIDEVMVEYGKFTTSGADHVDYKNWYDAPKLTDNNEVILEYCHLPIEGKVFEKMYSRDEVKSKLEGLVNHIENINGATLLETDKWIEENL